MMVGLRANWTLRGCLLAALLAGALAGCGRREVHQPLVPQPQNAAVVPTVATIQPLSTKAVAVKGYAHLWQPTWNGQSTLLACCADGDPKDRYEPKAGLFLLSPEGAVTPVAEGTHQCSGPTFSPDGQHLVFGLARVGYTREQKQLLDSGPRNAEEAWLMTKQKADEIARLGALSLDTECRLCTLAGGRVSKDVALPTKLPLGQLCWSPQGDLLAGWSSERVSRVCVVSPTAKRYWHEWPVPDEAALRRPPIWSPDGLQLTMFGTALLPQGLRRDLLCLTTESGNWQLVAEGRDLGGSGAETLAWSPDSKALCFYRTVDGTVEFRRFEVATKTEELLFSLPLKPMQGLNGLAWSPSRTAVAFLVMPATGSWSQPNENALYVLSQGGLEQLTLPETDLSEVAWSPDGRWLATVAGGNQVFFIELPEKLRD